jgi:hypothetical protein
VTLKFSRAVYAEEDLRAAALALAGRAQAALSRSKTELLVELRPAKAALEGEFANEALNHAYRRRVVAFHQKLAAPVLGRLFEQGFSIVAPDPLEQLEPQVAADREEERLSLLARTRALR